MKRGPKPKLNWTPSLNHFTCTINKTLYKLGQDEKKAKQQFDFLTKSNNPNDPNPLFAIIADKWLGKVKEENSAGRYRNCKARMEEFCSFVGEIKIRDLHPDMLEKWIVSRNIKKPGTIRLFKATILAALNWAAHPKRALIPSNPLKGLVSLPEGGSRGGEVLWTPEIFEQVLADVNPNFQDFLKACAWTGARPGVIRKVEARHYNKALKLWDVEDLFPIHSKKKTKRVWLQPKMVELVERLNAENPTGPIFRNHYGKPYLDSAVTQMVFNARLRSEKTDKPLPKGLVVYGLRHTFATNFIVAHPDKLEYLRELLGHRDLEMIRKHYGHLFDQHSHLHGVLSFSGL